MILSTVHTDKEGGCHSGYIAKKLQLYLYIYLSVSAKHMEMFMSSVVFVASVAHYLQFRLPI